MKKTKEKMGCFNKKQLKLNKKDNIYILKASSKDGCELLKLGYTSNLNNRMVSYFSHNPFTEILFTFHIEEGLKFEKWFHDNHMSDCRSEWYSIDMLDYILESIKTNEESHIPKCIIDYDINNNTLRNVDSNKKKCYVCNKIKEKIFFNRDVSKKSGLCAMCKDCLKIKNKCYRDKNKK